MAEVLGSIKSNTVVKADHVDLIASTAINPQTHGSRLLAINKTIGADLTFTLDTVKAPGVNYNFVYQGNGVAGNDIVIICQGASDTFSGSLTHVDTGATDAASGVRANAGTHDKLTITTPAGFNVNLTSNTSVGDATASWIISGYTVGATAPTFASS